MKKKPTKYLNYTIVCWVFGLAALILETVSIGLYLAKWSGFIWVLITLSSIGFVFLGIAIAMVIVMNFDKDKSVQEEIDYQEKEQILKMFVIKSSSIEGDFFVKKIKQAPDKSSRPALFCLLDLKED